MDTVLEQPAVDVRQLGKVLREIALALFVGRVQHLKHLQEKRSQVRTVLRGAVKDEITEVATRPDLCIVCKKTKQESYRQDNEVVSHVALLLEMFVNVAQHLRGSNGHC